MRKAAEMIKSVLQAAPIQAITAGREFWELANEEQPRPFITYSIKEAANGTKDLISEYNAELLIFHETLGQAADLADLVKDNSPGLKYRGGQSGYTDGDTKIAFILMNFNFKIRK